MAAKWPTTSTKVERRCRLRCVWRWEGPSALQESQQTLMEMMSCGRSPQWADRSMTAATTPWVTRTEASEAANEWCKTGIWVNCDEGSKAVPSAATEGRGDRIAAGRWVILGMSAPTDQAIRQRPTSVLYSSDEELLSKVPADRLREDGAGETSDRGTSDGQIPNWLYSDKLGGHQYQQWRCGTQENVTVLHQGMT